MAGLDGNMVRWGQLSSVGVVTHETAFDLPEQPATTTGGQALGPLFAVTSKTVPGDQLVVVMGVLQTGTTDHYEIHAAVYDWDSQVPVAVNTLAVQAAAANSGAVRLQAGSAAGGTRAMVLWGVEGQLVPIRYQMIGADGALVGAQGKIDDAPDPNNIALWTCLDTTQSGSKLAVTLVESPNQYHPAEPAWHRYAINDDGSVGEEALIYMQYAVSDCRIVSTPTSDGYLVAWQNNASNGGTFVASLTPPAPDAASGGADDVTVRAVLASASYGGYAQMPKIAWIAPIGYEFTVGLARTGGPQVLRFDAFADPKGKGLYLPSAAGSTGPVSAWVGSDATYVTYLDMPASSNQADAAVAAGSQRLFVTVLSPAELH